MGGRIQARSDWRRSGPYCLYATGVYTALLGYADCPPYMESICLTSGIFCAISAHMVKPRKPEPRPSPFPLRLEPDLRKRLEELAASERRSLTNFLMNVIQDRVDSEKRKER